MPAYKEEGGSWSCKFRYTNAAGEKKQKHKRGFLRKKDAEIWEKDFKDKYMKSPDIPFEAFAEKYMEDLVKNEKIEITTAARKQNMIDNKITPFFKKNPINEIMPLDVLNWQSWVRQKGYDEYDQEYGYADTYLKAVNNELSAMLNHARRYYSLANNAAQIAGSMGRSSADAMKIWTLDDFKQFKSYLVKPPAKVAFDILYWTGIREGELLALTKADFLPDHKLNITKNFQIVNGDSIIKAPKTENSIRCISIPEFLYNEVMEYTDKLYGLEPTDRIFMFTASYLRKELKSTAAVAGLAPIRVHDLRHSHVSLLIEMGFNIIAISERIGHKDVSVTLDTYAHLYPGKGKEVALGLQDANINGLAPGKGTMEAQLLNIMTELKQSLPVLPDNSIYENDDVIVWDATNKRKNVISFQELPTMLTIAADPEAAYENMLQDGYYQLVPGTILCFSKRGMPTEFL